MVTSTEQAGSIIRRMRTEKNMSRAELSARTGVAPRTLYDLETGRSENFGLGKYLKLLDALGLTMDIGFKDVPSSSTSQQTSPQTSSLTPSHWDDLADIWKLDGGISQ